MSNEYFILSINGVFNANEKWVKHIELRNGFVSTLEDLQDGYFIILSEQQKEFYLLHPEYTIENIYYMIDPSPDEKYHLFLASVDKVRTTRKHLYQTQSDYLYIEYQKDLALGDLEKAEISKQAWLAKVREIEENNPYPTE